MEHAGRGAEDGGAIREWAEADLGWAQGALLAAGSLVLAVVGLAKWAVFDGDCAAVAPVVQDVAAECCRHCCCRHVPPYWSKLSGCLYLRCYRRKYKYSDELRVCIRKQKGKPRRVAEALSGLFTY